jgi:hypothetical protein
MVTKEGLILQQVEDGKTSYEMAKHIGIASRTIRRFKERKSKGKLIYSKDGRPPSIDKTSEEAVIDWIHENPYYDRQRLQAIIWQECRETFMRKHPLYVHSDRRKKNFASRHTIYRWYKYFNTYSFENLIT